MWNLFWVLFKYKDINPPVEPTEVVLQATTDAGHPRTPWERTLERLHIGREADLIQKKAVFYLNDW